MSDILPIDREKLVELEPIKEKDEEEGSASEASSDEEETTPKVLTDDDIFEKPKKHA